VFTISRFTDNAHEKAIQRTLYWQHRIPSTREETYGYATYLYELKDYREAVRWYEKAAAEGHVPAMYMLAYCMRNGYGRCSDREEEHSLFGRAMAGDIHSMDARAQYRLGMCYTYGYGVIKDERKGTAFFQQAQHLNGYALHQMGLAYRDGREDLPVNRQQAEVLLRKAYDLYCEEAIFDLFDLYSGHRETFPYQQELKEAWSFRLGQLIRVTELTPCDEYRKRLSEFYLKGFPGDSADNNQKWERLAVQSHL
jgi:tetratricopeptide (TPR) repeat protein